eukprot:TRINITY_DN9110_c0_g1_i1.p1 TRINITY_DN9110_c0_g1~~TRINITY_DN9110_c0_g1_i1.p1  ORF type:complete len:433 (-),score=102.11 TRINITY_DN9110_c0_g1_i1:124-1365(-)
MAAARIPTNPLVVATMQCHVQNLRELLETETIKSETATLLLRVLAIQLDQMAEPQLDSIIAIIQLLCKQGGDVNTILPGKTSFVGAISNLEVIRSLMEQKLLRLDVECADNLFPVQKWAELGWYQAIELLKDGTELNRPNREAHTAMHFFFTGKTKPLNRTCFMKMLELGGDMLAKDKRGVTPMKFLIDYSKTDSSLLDAFYLYFQTQRSLLSNYRDMIDGEGHRTLDVTLNVSEHREIKSFTTSKFLLAAHSEKFRTLYGNCNFKESGESVLSINDTNPKVFGELLNFFVEGHLPLFTETNYQEALDLLKMADEYLCEQLKTRLEIILLELLRLTNATELLVAADKFHLKNLKEQSIRLIADKFGELCERKDFRTFMAAETELMVDILAKKGEKKKRKREQNPAPKKKGRRS